MRIFLTIVTFIFSSCSQLVDYKEMPQTGFYKVPDEMEADNKMAFTIETYKPLNEEIFISLLTLAKKQAQKSTCAGEHNFNSLKLEITEAGDNYKLKYQFACDKDTGIIEMNNPLKDEYPHRNK